MVSTLVKGMAAGTGAAWAKNTATTWIHDHEAPEARRREDEARHHDFPYDVAARKAADLLGTEPTADQERRVGQAIHWSLGIGSVVLYAFLRRRDPRITATHGLAFGLPFTWLLLDETVNPLLGLSPAPQRFPWQTHARAAAGHAVLWLTAETLLRLLDGRGAKR